MTLSILLLLVSVVLLIVGGESLYRVFVTREASGVALPVLITAAGAAAMLLAFVLNARSARRTAESESVLDRITDPGREAGVTFKGLMLLNLPSGAGLDAIESAPPLGSRADVLASCAAALPSIRFDEHGIGRATFDDGQLTLEAGGDETVWTLVAAGEGRGAGLGLLALVETAKWRVYAPRRGAFVDGSSVEPL